MKCAKEMFENLGYTYQEAYFEDELDEINYSKNGRWALQIIFSLNHKCIMVYRKYEGKSRPIAISVEILQAINKQVEELGWLDES